MATTSSSPGDPPTVDGFLKAVLRSGLLDRDQLRAALGGAPPGQREDALALADYLVRTGNLSRFQARKLLKGHALGLILGPFQVLAPIGRGGMGTVYMVRDGRNNQLVALKVLPPRRAREEERLLARFRREMELSRRVAHHHLAWTYEVGEVRGVCYIAMEYIPGKNLRRLVSEQGPLPVPRAARLMAEVASALEHAHNQGLIHRDLKPSNIVVTPNDHAKVLDLGLALMHGEEPSEVDVVGGQGYIVGTMDYIAPEQTTDPLKVDRRADIYALGCTLYYALSGQPPFPGGTSREKIHRHRGEEPVPLLELRPALPPAFAALVHKMMAKDPARRFPSAAAAGGELLAWAEASDLPLDRPDDPRYAEAIDSLRASESGAELSLPKLDPPQEVPEGEADGRGLAWLFPTPGESPAPAGAERPPRLPGLLVSAGLALLIVSVVLGGLGLWLFGLALLILSAVPGGLGLWLWRR
jgi:serine/threonine protein kinase